MPFQIPLSTKIRKAMNARDSEEVMQLIKQFAATQEKYKDCSPLYVACAEGSVNVVSFLLENTDIDINSPNKQGYTPLMIACINGYEPTVKYLVDQPNINLNASMDMDGVRHTALTLAIINGRASIVKIFAEIESDNKLNLGNYSYSRKVDFVSITKDAKLMNIIKEKIPYFEELISLLVEKQLSAQRIANLTVQLKDTYIESRDRVIRKTIENLSKEIDMGADSSTSTYRYSR